MKIGIIDADLIGREKHRFPNLAWETVIDNFANGNNSKVDKGIIYDYYCLKKIRPSYDGAGASRHSLSASGVHFPQSAD